MVGMVALVACNNTSFQPNTSKPTETSGNTSVEPTESSEPTDSSEATDPYKDRIKSKDFKVINISNEKQSSNDPRFFDEAKPLSAYLKADTYKLNYLDEVNDVYQLMLIYIRVILKMVSLIPLLKKMVLQPGLQKWALLPIH